MKLVSQTSRDLCHHSCLCFYFNFLIVSPELKKARWRHIAGRRRVLPGYQVDSESEPPGRVHLRGCKPQGSVGNRHRRAAASVRVFAWARTRPYCRGVGRLSGSSRKRGYELVTREALARWPGVEGTWSAIKWLEHPKFNWIARWEIKFIFVTCKKRGFVVEVLGIKL